jgi:hypothetical protein
MEDGMGFIENGRSRGVFAKIVRAFDHFVYAGPNGLSCGIHFFVLRNRDVLAIKRIVEP